MPKKFPKPNPKSGVGGDKTILSLLSRHMLGGVNSISQLGTTEKAGLNSHRDFARVGGSLRPTFNNQAMITVVHFIPSLSVQGTDDSLVLSAAYYEYYNYIRRHNASLGSYLPIDVFKNFFAIANLNLLFGSILLDLKILNTKSHPTNLAYGEMLANAISSNPSTDRRELAANVGLFNECVALAADLCVPKDFRIAARYMALTNVVYADDPTIDKTQLVLFKPTALYALNTNPEDDHVGELELVEIPRTVYQKIALLQRLIYRYAVDEDMQKMLAEVRKAYLPSEILEYKEYSNEPISVVYEQELMDQLRNTQTIGDIALEDKAWNIYEEVESGLLRGCEGDIHPVWTPGTDESSATTGLRFISEAGAESNIYAQKTLYSHEDQPSADTIATITAFAPVFNMVEGTEANKGKLLSCGTEMIQYFELYFKSSDAQFTSITVGNVNAISHASNFEYTVELLNLMFKASTFSCLPPMYVFIGDGDPFVVEGDVDNRFRGFNQQKMCRIHAACNAWSVFPSMKDGSTSKEE